VIDPRVKGTPKVTRCGDPVVTFSVGYSFTCMLPFGSAGATNGNTAALAIKQQPIIIPQAILKILSLFIRSPFVSVIQCSF
jgi:hypothetical protein